jgi:hypothetical protein
MRQLDIARAAVLMEALSKCGRCGLSTIVVAAYLSEVNDRPFASRSSSRRQATRAMRALEASGLYEIFTDHAGKPGRAMFRIRRISKSLSAGQRDVLYS